METNKGNNGCRHSVFHYVIGGLLVAVGALLLGRNLGYIDNDLFRIIVSWPSAIIVVSLLFFMHRTYIGGCVLLAVGVYFLIARMGCCAEQAMVYFWPAIFIIMGVGFAFRMFSGRSCHGHWHGRWKRNAKTVSKFEMNDGLVAISVSFGETRQAVVDKEFLGGKINAGFGSVVLDLRRATLPEGEHQLEVQASFAGIELFVPSTWRVEYVGSSFLAGVDDKRMQVISPEGNGKLLITGSLSFAGIEINS